MRGVEPSLATALLIDVDEDPFCALVTAREHGHEGLHPFFFSVNAALVKACKQTGMAIRTWTVDDPVQIAVLAGLGVDAVVTNDVVAARRALGRSDLPGGTGAPGLAPPPVTS